MFVYTKEDKFSYEYIVEKCLAKDSPFNTRRGYSVSYDEKTKTLRTLQGSILHSNGLMSINLSNFIDMQHYNYIRDGLGLYVEFEKNKKRGSTCFRWAYPTVRPIYNLYTDKVINGFIGRINSSYNRINISVNDLVFRYFDSPSYIVNRYFSMDSDSQRHLNYRISISNVNNNEYIYNLLNEWANVWYHVPMWINEPYYYLRDALRIAALKLATDRVEFKRHLYIGISHQETITKGSRIILLSYLGKKLAKLKVPPDYIKLVKSILKEFNGYTSNYYLSWFYLPTIEPIEYTKVFDKAIKRYNSLPISVL